MTAIIASTLAYPPCYFAMILVKHQRIAFGAIAENHIFSQDRICSVSKGSRFLKKAQKERAISHDFFIVCCRFVFSFQPNTASAQLRRIHCFFLKAAGSCHLKIGLITGFHFLAFAFFCALHGHMFYHLT